MPTYKPFPTLPSAAPFIVTPLSQEDGYDAIQDVAGCGATTMRERWPYPLRTWELVGTPLPEADYLAMMGFLHGRKGGAEPFYLPGSTIKVYDPYDAPDLSRAAGGTMAGRTYYAKIAWSNGTLLTRPSQEASFAVDANNYLVVTVDDWPRAVSETWVYIGASAGAEKYVAKITTSGSTFTEPYSAVNADSASGQKILNVGSTTNFQIGMPVLIGSGTAREEIKTIDTIQVGVSLTMTLNLTYTHTAVQADPVQIDMTTGAAFPTTNNFFETPLIVLIENPRSTRVTNNTWEIALKVREVWP